jgi:lysophospholipid hydrolase
LGGFAQFNDVYKVGLTAGREILQKWKEEGRLPTGLVDDVKGEKAIKRGARLRRMSI